MPRICRLILPALLVLLSVFPARADEPVRLGVIAARTGDAAVSNLAMFDAARFAVDELNAAGGLLGRPVDILEYDNLSTALGSRAAAEAAVNDRVDAVVGASWSEHSLAIAPVLQAAGIPMITPISTNPKVTEAGDYIFRACITDAFQGRVMARFAREDLKATSAVTLVNISRTYSVDLAQVFEDTFNALGGLFLGRGVYTLDTANYAGILATVEAADPDVIYVPGDYRDSSFIIKEARERGLRAAILGADGFGLRLYDYIGTAAEGCYYTTHWRRDSPLPASRDFVARYEAKHGDIRQTTIPLTYDAVMLWADAARRAGTIEHHAVRDALAATRGFSGATGSITFDDSRNPAKPVVINKLENLGTTLVKLVEP
jgi:branched-chain amino acid transport system substrate-binding protein